MKALIDTNPYLINKTQRDRSIARSTRSSCGVEGIVAQPALINHLKIDTSRSDALFNKLKNQLQKNQ